MLRIKELKLPIDHTGEDLAASICKLLRITSETLISHKVVRQSVDARQRDRILFIYTIDIDVEDEDKILQSASSSSISKNTIKQYTYPSATRSLSKRPVIVGTGPAGLFVGLVLARAGYNPILLERGKPVEARVSDIEQFWTRGVLDENSNVQFGEGGAGTFSDGKLNTLINDFRCIKVLEEFVDAGAPSEILYKAKPHIGTDRLREVVKTIRQKIEHFGGEYWFDSRVTDIVIKDGRCGAVVINNTKTIESSDIVFAIGNGARDTFLMLYNAGVMLESKPFSIGLRIEHPATLIDKSRYGHYAGHPALGAADYKLVHHCSSGYSAYTFCMCPGGSVVAAASEKGGVVTNGMSRFARDGRNSNSALLVGVGRKEFGDHGPLAGIEFQRIWERKAFESGGGNYFAPVQRVDDFLHSKPTGRLTPVVPSYAPGVVPSDLSRCLPPYVCAALREAIVAFNSKLKGFSLPDAVLTGVETRSSSPIRIIRNEKCETSVPGLYSAGEGAGYAGGIMSAAVDGIKVAEAIILR